MSDTTVADGKPPISFFQGSDDIGDKSPIDLIKQKIAEFSNVKNVSFLLGAGTSSDIIPSMKEMHKEITKEIKKSKDLNETSKTTYECIQKDNLEGVLNVLYAKQSYMQSYSDSSQDEQESVDSLIKHIENKIFSKININLSKEEAENSLNLYKRLYQKIALRNKDLSRINIFTTNNDLLNEKALDNLNINYNNGFGGGLDRVFNPARFHYTFSKKIDANLEKFEPLENMIYLYKLHGSISWIEKEGNSLFNIQEVPVEGGAGKSEEQHVLIYPTPLKQNQSLGSPYSDLIREFQTKLSQPNSVLFIIGYSFSDEHLNNIIYQSLASNSSILIVIFGEHADCPLVKINDRRIYRIFGEAENEQKIHHFEYIVNHLLPDLDENKEEILLDTFVTAFKQATQNGDG